MWRSMGKDEPQDFFVADIERKVVRQFRDQGESDFSGTINLVPIGRDKRSVGSAPSLRCPARAYCTCRQEEANRWAASDPEKAEKFSMWVLSCSLDRGTPG